MTATADGDAYAAGINSDLVDRVTSFYEVEKFVSETDSIHPLAIQVGVPECVQLSVFKGTDDWQFTLRWVLLHLIEETARHAGHADLLREAIDGSVGE